MFKKKPQQWSMEDLFCLLLKMTNLFSQPLFLFILALCLHNIIVVDGHFNVLIITYNTQLNFI